MNNKKIRIGLFLGGSSSEKEISLESGRHVYNNLDSEKYLVIPIFVDQHNHFWQIEEGLLWMNTCSDIEAQLESQAQRLYFEDLPEKIDYAFLALHGKYGEECIPALLELFGIPNNSSGVLGGSIGMDKVFQRELLRANGCEVADYITVDIKDWRSNVGTNRDLSKKKKIIDEIERKLGYPFVVKPAREGCSVAITKVKNRTEIDKAFESAFAYDNVILCEEFLQGKEVTTTVLKVNGELKALTPTETPYRGDFLSVEEKFLPGDATMITPPNLPEKDIKKIQTEAVKAYQALRQKSCSRIDGIWSFDKAQDKKNGKLYILEPNCPPGLTPSTMVFHQAAEMGWTSREFFEKIIDSLFPSN